MRFKEVNRASGAQDRTPQAAADDLWGLAASLRVLDEMSQAAVKPRLLPIVGLDERAVVAIGQGLFEVDLPYVRPRRRHTVLDIDSLVRSIPLSANCKLSANPQAVVWIGDTRVQVVLDDRDGRDVVTLLLHPTRFAMSMLAMAQRGFKQPDLVRMLRVDLADHGGRQLVPFYRRLKFFGQRMAEGVVDPTRESLGQEVVRELTGDVDLPEDHTFSGPWLLEHEQQVTVTCAVDVNHEQSSIAIRPVGDSLDRVRRETREGIADAIGERLAAEQLEATVLFGDPGTIPGEEEDED